MTTEQLMQPRYKVIADYPNSPYGLNDVLTNKEVRFGMGRLMPEHYPAIFRKLEWWEERAVEDMPEWVKYDPLRFPQWEKIMKVAKWNGIGTFDFCGNTIMRRYPNAVNSLAFAAYSLCLIPVFPLWCLLPPLHSHDE